MKETNLDYQNGVSNEESHFDVFQKNQTDVTNAPSKSIKAIDRTTVHRICSGQVMLYNFFIY